MEVSDLSFLDWCIIVGGCLCAAIAVYWVLNLVEPRNKPVPFVMPSLPNRSLSLDNETVVVPPVIPVVPNVSVSVMNKTIVVKPVSCYHGVLVNLSDGRTICTRSLGGRELRNYTFWLANETAYNMSQGLPSVYNQSVGYYMYFRDNCTSVPDGYVWDPNDWIVNSTHPLTCPEIRTWNHNDGHR